MNEKTGFRLAPRAIALLPCQGLLAVLALSGCVSISDVDASKAEPTCARGCADRFSSCTGVTFATMNTIYACKEAYSACIKTCPAK